MAKSGMTKHGHRLVYLVLIQSIVILWLASWAVGDYLNNIYVRAYVDSEIAAYGLIMTLVIILGSVGGGYGLMHRRHKLSGESVQLGVSESKGSLPSPKSRPSFSAKATSTIAKMGASSAKMAGPSPTSVLSAPAPVVSSAPVKSIDSIIASVSPPSTDASPKPSGELHPAVAALKAELSERRVNLGLMSATMGQETGQAPAPRSATPPVSAPVQERPVLSVSEPAIVQNQPQPSPTPPPAQQSSFSRPGLIPPMPQPSTVVRQGPPSQVARPLQPPQGVRPGQPFSFGRPFQRPGVPGSPAQPGARQGAMGNERFEDAARKAGFQLAQSQGPTQSPPAPPAAPSIPRNVTTVITGVMPVKKKDDGSDKEESKSQ